MCSACAQAVARRCEGLPELELPGPCEAVTLGSDYWGYGSRLEDSRCEVERTGRRAPALSASSADDGFGVTLYSPYRAKLLSLPHRILNSLIKTITTTENHLRGMRNNHDFVPDDEALRPNERVNEEACNAMNDHV